MATIAIGDIHGNRAALLDLLGQLRDNVSEADRVVFLGDYIDRGPDARGCVDAILAFRREVPASVTYLRGNHEDWMLRTQEDYTRHSWLIGMEALDTVRSYSLEAQRVLLEALTDAGLSLFLEHPKLPYGAFFDVLPAAHRAFFAGLLPFVQTPDCICTHAGLDPRVPELKRQALDSFIWGGPGFPAQYKGELPIVYGHWNNAQVGADRWPRPSIIGNTVGIDTIAHGVLTAIRMPDRTVFQSGRHKPGV